MSILALPTRHSKLGTVYRGERTPAGPVVTADGAPLDPGPSLARALLLDVTGSPRLADRYGRAFAAEVVAGWRESWAITGREVLTWLANRQRGPDPE